MPRPWSCRVRAPGCTREEPCRSCKGRQAHAQGHEGQNRVRKALERVFGIKSNRYRSKVTNEENWRLPWRVEVKTDKRSVDAAFTAFGRHRSQSYAAKPLGDPRAFVSAVYSEERRAFLLQVHEDDLDRFLSDAFEQFLDRQLRDEAASPARRIGGAG